MTKGDVDGYEGWCGGDTVYVDTDERSTCVLGPDGNPIRVTRRRPVGFDLTPGRKKSAQAALHRAREGVSHREH